MSAPCCACRACRACIGSSEETRVAVGRGVSRVAVPRCRRAFVPIETSLLPWEIEASWLLSRSYISSRQSDPLQAGSPAVDRLISADHQGHFDLEGPSPDTKSTFFLIKRLFFVSHASISLVSLESRRMFPWLMKPLSTNARLISLQHPSTALRRAPFRPSLTRTL